MTDTLPAPLTTLDALADSITMTARGWLKRERVVDKPEQDNLYVAIRAELYAALADAQRRAERMEAENAQLREDNTDLNQIFELQHMRMVEATKQWRAATGRHNVSPDLGELLQFLMDRADGEVKP